MKKLLLTAILTNLLAVCAFAQATEFTYQGRLLDNTLPPTANYDFEFSLWDSLVAGTQQGATQTITGVSVANGIFTVKLNFGAQFNGTPRFLQIAMRSAGGGAYTTLAPRQPFTSAPYAIKSLNAENATNAVNADIAADSNRLGGITADQYVQTTDARMTDARAPLPGSANYVQNTTSPQTSSNFNISGTGTANIFNAATQFNIGGSRAFIAQGGAQNVFAGISSGMSNTTGFGNTFVGNFSGNANATGFNNSFFGTDAGRSTNGDGNSFFGRSAGFATTTGTNNVFFGRDSGRFNISGNFNAFFGTESGFNNTADGNSFFGYRVGLNNTTGDRNAFFGNSAGQANTTSSFNAFFGSEAGLNNTSGGNSFFGNSAGRSNTTGGNNAFFGTVAGQANTTGSFNAFFGGGAGSNNTTGSSNTLIGVAADVGAGNLTFATAIGSGSTVSGNNTIALGRSGGQDSVLAYGSVSVIGSLGVGGVVSLSLGAAGSTTLCRNASNQISTCSSSLRYKTNVQTFSGGLDLLRRFHPVTFAWKADGKPDLGFVAEEVNEIEPLLTTFNDKGEIEGVKYAQITTVLVNSVKEQQAQIEAQKKQNAKLQQHLKQQQEQINALKRLVCPQNPQAEVCRENQ